jgi:hypothetical protein
MSDLRIIILWRTLSTHLSTLSHPCAYWVKPPSNAGRMQALAPIFAVDYDSANALRRRIMKKATSAECRRGYQIALCVPFATCCLEQGRIDTSPPAHYIRCLWRSGEGRLRAAASWVPWGRLAVWLLEASY